MKYILLSVLIVMSLPVRAADADKMSISELLQKIASIRTISVVGWEVVQGANSNISDKIAITEAIKNADLTSLNKIIAADTDYECLIGSNYIVISPKTNPSKYNTPLSKRILEVSEANNLSQDLFLKQLRAESGNSEHVFLEKESFTIPQISNGNISEKAGKRICFEVLNDMARQLNAKIWVMDDGALVDDYGTPILPMNLMQAHVYFE